MAANVLILRGSKGLSLANGDNPYDELKTLSASNAVQSIDVSTDGKYLAFCDKNSVKVVTLPDCQSVLELNGVNVNFVKLSPKATVLATWHHFTASQPLNLNLYNVSTQTHLIGLQQKKPSRWCPNWTEDELVCVRHINMELNFYENNAFERYTQRMVAQKVANYSMITNNQTGCHYVACYTVGVKGQPSFVRIYQFPRFDGLAIANKSFYKADTVDFKWNHKGDALLLICSTDVDQSGKSYYGQQTLHYLDITGQTFIVSLKKDGPIHNTAWVPNNNTLFCVIYGNMPPKASLFNNKSDVVFDFGEEMWNIISFNRFGNMVALAGFGNLRGGVHVWDMKQKQRISQFKAPDTTHIDWCPDGRHMLTATTAPRLRVGNGYRIWNYNGVRDHENIFDTNTELYEILWRPSQAFTEPVVEVQKRNTVPKPIEPKKYIPPHLRKTTTNPSNNSKIANPNQKQLTDNEKKVKNVEKKLKAITDLKEMLATGKTLEKNQLEKITKEQELLDELKELRISL